MNVSQGRGEKGRQQYSPYKVVYKAGRGEYEEKRSRFIAYAAPVSSEQEAASFFETIRKKHYDARHNCTAFIIGRNRELTRCSDDGEPSGTAGKPILEVLLGAEVTDAAVVVARYFGGTLLGTGGLVRAYTQAAKAGLADAGIALMRYGAYLTISADYPDISRIQYLLEHYRVTTEDSRYLQTVEFDVRVPWELVQELSQKLTETTAGRARIAMTRQGYFKDPLS